MNLPRTTRIIHTSLLLGYLLTGSSAQGQSDLHPYQAVLDTLQLSRVANLDFHPDYGLLIADSREMRVWRIAPDGQSDSIHKPGQGPGEYERLIAVKWGPGGTVYIAGNTRVVVYSNTLEYESWSGQLRPVDVEPTEDGRVYVSVDGGGDGPVVKMDPATETFVHVTEWRNSDEITGLPEFPAASRALLQWDSETDLLYICYLVDAFIEVVRNSTVVNSFILPCEAVERSIEGMQRANKNRTGNVMGSISFPVFTFCITENGNLLVSLGGELIHTTPEGIVLHKAPWPTGYRQFYTGPDGFLFSVNRETMLIESFRLNDLFPY